MQHDLIVKLGFFRAEGLRQRFDARLLGQIIASASGTVCANAIWCSNTPMSCSAASKDKLRRHIVGHANKPAPSWCDSASSRSNRYA